MNSLKLPNFFLIGAPKCGTTALSTYLSQHPQIFFSNPKEPHFFNDDFINRHTHSFDTYLSYFKDVKEQHKAIGEGSVFYLYSETAIDNILKIEPNAKFIVMLRNPVEVAYSCHSEAISNHGETIFDFERAWKLCEKREQNKSIPFANRYREALLYNKIPKLGKQVERLLTSVKRENIHFITYDDFKENSQAEYIKTINFLNLENFIPENFQKININTTPRNKLLKKILAKVIAVKQRLGIEKSLGFGVIGRINKVNEKISPRVPLDPVFEAKLRFYFRDDVTLLSKLLQKDFLKLWKIE